MKLVVGLGNPGRRYVGTRHNVGFEVLAELARRFGTSTAKKRFNAEVVDASIDGESVLLLCPQTYMNLSGTSVQPARDFYKLDNEQLLVVCDDFNLPLAKMRFRSEGSSGGQKGLRDVINRLSTECFPRLRIGVGPPKNGWDVADFVLSKFEKQERSEVESIVLRAADAIADWTRHGIEYCMNQYNAG
jgi:peptidyl-tRNA hydrolase, PTH1 family